MAKLKWLYPGMRVKRWLALLILGIFGIAVGLTVLFHLPWMSSIEQQILEWFNGSYTYGALLILLGAACVIVAIRCGLNSVVRAIKPQISSDLASELYKQRSLEKGPHIVVIGGGTGLSTMLRGLKEYSANITAIVTVADNGGSSGRIRDELGILPPGDIRNTVIALADTEPLMEKLFQYRFSWGEGLKGHSFGNLFLAAMADITGDFEESIKEFSKVLAVRGKVLPSTLATVQLKAEYTDGTETVGEAEIPQPGKEISRVSLVPSEVKAVPEAVQAILDADLIVLGPGSLYTSVIPNLLVDPIVEALEQAEAIKVYVCNVMTQPGETTGFSASDHVYALLKHADFRPIIDYVLVNDTPISSWQAEKYAEQGAYPVQLDRNRLENMGLEVVTGSLIDHADLVRHNSARLAEALLRIWEKHR
ncbi:MAG: uridine diphosphate-N-acetylglucosamine-binding protein YvcK [Firmicutes bacterium]|nr:uridine diphosphate-N-acetylglucosamine-binding protein YvcK [Bacillota bacterium]